MAAGRDYQNGKGRAARRMDDLLDKDSQFCARSANHYRRVLFCIFIKHHPATMHYIKLKSEGTIIEFHNNWLGEETVIVGGKTVSKKSSIMGANHFFTVVENGALVNYVLTSKVLDSFMNVGVDLIRNGQVIYANVPLSYGSKPKSPHEELKSKALAKLIAFEIPEALDLLKRAQQLEPDDYEIYFHLACAYSNLEDLENGYANLKLAVQHGMNDFEKILNHDMLAFLRLQDPFERFQESGFTEY